MVLDPRTLLKKVFFFKLLFDGLTLTWGKQKKQTPIFRVLGGGGSPNPLLKNSAPFGFSRGGGGGPNEKNPTALSRFYF